MSNEITMHGPIVFEMKVHIMNPETEQTGTMTVGLGAGKYPTQQDVQERMERLQGEIAKHAPGFELMNRREFMAELMEEHSGHRMYVACSNEWDEIDD